MGPEKVVLFVCVENSNRSQMAEAILNRKGRGRFIAESAGSDPAARVNPYAIDAMREMGIDWCGHQPRGIDDLVHENWDIVLTVCDNAREACPVFPGQPALAAEDPAPCPVAARVCDEILSLPLHPGLREDDIDHIAAAIHAFEPRTVVS